MKFQVTKKQVLKAIETEPLRAEAFVHLVDDDNGNRIVDKKKFKNKTGCAVCAVGAIMDCSLGNKLDPDDLNSTAQDLVDDATFSSTNNFDPSHDSIEQLVIEAKVLTVRGKPLSALSSLFEELMTRDGMQTQSGYANKKARKILTNFVKESFPNTLKLDTEERY